MAKKFSYTEEEWNDFKKYLEDNKIPHSLEASGSTNTLYSKIGIAKVVKQKVVKGKVVSGRLPHHQLGFINRVRNQIIRTLKNTKNFWKGKDIVNGKKIKLEYSSDGKPDIAYSRWTTELKIGKEFNDIYEVDIRNAYWNIVMRWGLITKALYLEGRRRKKKLRLIALGSLAKKKYIYKYDIETGAQVFQGIKFNRRTTKLWNNVCSIVGESIINVQNILSPKDFIFFWVDGIYFRGEHNVDKVLDEFKRHGFRCKVKKIYKIRIEVDKEHNTNASTIVVYETKKQFNNRNKKGKDKDEGGRPFFVSKEAFK